MREMNKTQLFETPFSKEYWRLAAGELRSTKILVLAAILTALRIAVKSLAIPVGPNLNITFGFLINATGSMIYGPIVAILTSAISDTLGAILFPHGAYFFPFIFEEIAGGVIFALFYYRTKLHSLRVILGRFAVTVFVNLMISPVIMYYYYQTMLGKSYTILSMPRMVKNLVLFPLQSLALIFLFNALLPVTDSMGLTYTGRRKLEIRRKDIVALVILTIISAGVIVLYYRFTGVK
ncbi:MAG: folate family ECF transporter S component [Blautia sp.]|nr:folate family ECF transporter S component [Blautia sp.]